MVGVVHALHEVGKPARLALGADDLEPGEAFEDAAEDDVGEGALYLLDQVHVFRWTALPGIRAERGYAALGAHAGDDVQRERQGKLLGCLPERVVHPVKVGAAERGRGPDHAALQPQVGGAAQLLGATLNVPKRDHGDAVETIGGVGTELAQPVVVDLEAGVLQLGVVHGVEPEAQRAVEDFGLDAVGVLVFEPGRGVPAAGPRVLHRRFQEMLGEILVVLAQCPGPRNLLPTQAGNHEGGAYPVLVIDHAGRVVTERLVEPLCPEFARLHRMRIA